MAQKKAVTTRIQKLKVRKRTSIGRSPLSRPKNKNKRRSWKKYRGQG